MKKLLALFAIACGCALSEQPLTFSSTLTATGTSASAYTTNGVNGAIQPILNHTVAVVTAGSPSACSIRLEGSADNSHWFDISGANDCSGTDPGTGQPGVAFHVYGRLWKYLRVNLTAWTGGTSADVSYLGSN